MEFTEQYANALWETLPVEKKLVIARILSTLEKAENKHPNWPQDIIHASAILNEEAGELTRVTLQYVYEGGKGDEYRKEAEQTAAMGVRFLLHENYYTAEFKSQMIDAKAPIVGKEMFNHLAGGE